MWVCQRCTFENDETSTERCDMCHTKNPLAKRKASGASAPDKQQKKQKRVPTTAVSSFFQPRSSPPGTSKLGNQAQNPKENKENKSKENKPTAPPREKKLSNQSTLTSFRKPRASGSFVQSTTVRHGVPFNNLWEDSSNILRDTFGLEKLRFLQPNAVKGVLKRKNQLVVMATGGGKSLCYQLPACVLGGVTIVISPLIALMQDQTKGLAEKGIPAAFVSSSQTEKENRAVLERLLGRSSSSLTLKLTSDGGKKKTGEKSADKMEPLTLLYITPESVQTDRFRSILTQLHKKKQLALFAIDEAHCLSSWGHDFRPAYRRLGYLRDKFPDVPCLALTATATPRVIDDIRDSLKLKGADTHIGSFDRPNIFYKVRYRDSLDATKPGGALADLVRFVKGRHDQALKDGVPCSGIVYCHKRDDTASVARAISRDAGICAEPYHAGLKDAQRTEIQTKWTSGEVQVAVATVAFGMGIDLAHVRYVVHWALPKSVEGFYQESGRAGRDGLASHSLLYYSKKDASTFSFLAKQQYSKPGKEKSLQMALKALESMVEYCVTPACRRTFLLKHFGDTAAETNKCNKSCDYCSNPKKIEKAIQNSAVVKDAMGSHFARAKHKKKQQEWDGQWTSPHGDDNDGPSGNYNQWKNGSFSGGLQITGPMGTSDDPPNEGSSNKGSGVAPSSILDKYEAMECGERIAGGFVRFRDTSSDEKPVSRVIIPEHLRKDAPDPLKKFESTSKETKSSADYASQGKSIEADLVKIKAERESRLKLLMEKRIKANRKAPPPPPPPPPSFGISQPRKSQSHRR